MKKQYEEIFIEIVLIDEKDIVTGSGDQKFGTDYDNEKTIIW